MRPITYRLALAIALFSLVPSSISQALAAEDGFSVETALSVYHSATRQSEATVAAVRAERHDQATSDSAYEKAFLSAVWEGIKLIYPKATPDEIKRMASLIGDGKSLADASKGSALGHYMSNGVDVDSSLMFRIDKDADDAFRLGFAQGLNRERNYTAP